MNMTPEQIQFTIALCVSLVYFATQFVITCYQQDPTYVVLGLFTSGSMFYTILKINNDPRVAFCLIVFLISIFIRGILFGYSDRFFTKS